MIRLTVLYNLPQGTDEAEFLDWRLSDHQRSNESMPGVVRTDFARITECWPAAALPGYRFQTTVEWPSRESFDSGFRDEAFQAKLQQDLKRLADYAFIVSEVLIESGR